MEAYSTFAVQSGMKKGNKNILIVAATMMEITPLMEHLRQTYRQPGRQELLFEGEGLCIRVAICGIGLTATAFHLGQLLNTDTYDCALQLGIGGAYPTAQIALGAVVYVATDRIGDLGASTKAGDFLDLQQMGLAEPSAVPLPGNPPAGLSELLQQLPGAEGISVNHISGDPSWRNRFQIAPEAIVTESMEGAAFHYACITAHVPFIQLRSISNWVEPRDKSRWQIGIALENLNKTAIALLQHL